MDTKFEKNKVSNIKDLQCLIDRFHNGLPFAAAFEFDTDELWIEFLEAIGLNYESFNEKYYYFDVTKGIHISESENGYVWISTMGLVSKSRSTDNKYLNACSWQKIILIHLLDDAIRLSENEDIYDIDGYNYSMLEILTPALFHNTLFYFEIFAKAYLSINKQEVPPTHSLRDLFKLVKKTMFLRHQNNTLFHSYMIPAIESIVNHINSIPGEFKEQFVKYDDNPQDITVIDFNPQYLKNMKSLVEMSHDIVLEMYYDAKDCVYLCENWYQRLIERCDNEEDLKRVESTYHFLLEHFDGSN